MKTKTVYRAIKPVSFWGPCVLLLTRTGGVAAAYRFVTLIDVLYEHRVRLLAAAEAEPFSLFAAVITQADRRHTALTDFVVDDNLGFAKERIISRLTEMQSHEYARAHAEYVPLTGARLDTARVRGTQ